MSSVRLGIVLCLLFCASFARADDPAHSEGQAPPNHDVLKHVRGGAYFFLPSLRALRYLAAVRRS